MIGITINMIAFEIFILAVYTAIGAGLSESIKEGLKVGIILDIFVHICAIVVMLFATFGNTVIL